MSALIYINIAITISITVSVTRFIIFIFIISAEVRDAHITRIIAGFTRRANCSRYHPYHYAWGWVVTGVSTYTHVHTCTQMRQTSNSKKPILRIVEHFKSIARDGASTFPDCTCLVTRCGLHILELINLFQHLCLHIHDRTLLISHCW